MSEIILKEEYVKNRIMSLKLHYTCPTGWMSEEKLELWSRSDEVVESGRRWREW